MRNMLYPAADIETLARAVKSPAFITPWLHRFYEPAEVGLVLGLAAADAAAAPCSDTAFIQRAWRRGVVQQLADGRLTPADFHTRFEYWALFEGWQDVPAAIRRQLNEWETAAYVDGKKGQAATLRQGLDIDPALVWPAYLLPDEVDMLIDRAPAIYLWPCNCRAMMGRCRQPTLTCLRFDNDRGIGWEISKDRAKSIARESHRKGLMQVGEVGRRPDGSIRGAVCNCCADCCFPHQLARREGLERLWPLSRYLAVHDHAACDSCGRCVRRCPFDAFLWQPADAGSRRVHYRPDRCRGCGLCLSVCPQGAVSLQHLPPPTAAGVVTWYLHTPQGRLDPQGASRKPPSPTQIDFETK